MRSRRRRTRPARTLHVVVDHDRAVRQHVHLALEQVGVRQEADGQNRHFGRVLALFGDHSDGVVVIVAELDHLLAERERDAVLLERGRHLIGDGLIEIIGQRAIKPSTSVVLTPVTLNCSAISAPI